MRKFAFCLTLVSCLFISANAFAQVYSMGGPASGGCGCDGGGQTAQGCDTNLAPPSPACSVNHCRPVGPGCGVNGIGNSGLIGGGCGVDGGLIGPGCGTNGGCGGTGLCGGNCDGCRRGLFRRGRLRTGRLRGLRNQAGSFYFTADAGLSYLESPAEHIGAIGAAGGTPEYDIDEVIVARFGIGRTYGNWRLEGEYGYREYGLDEVERGVGFRAVDVFEVNGSRETETYMLNIFRDFNPGGRIRPYAKAGVGVSHNTNNATYNIDDNIPPDSILVGAYPEGDSYELAWSVGGGLGIALNQCTYLDIEYLYVEHGATATGLDASNDGLGFGDGWGHEFTMGLRFNF